MLFLSEVAFIGIEKRRRKKERKICPGIFVNHEVKLGVKVNLRSQGLLG